MNRQQVVVQNIHHRPGITPSERPDSLLASVCHRVVVGETVNRPVQQNPFLHALRVIFPCASFHIVADEVADEQVFIVERKETVGEVVHYVRRARDVKKSERCENKQLLQGKVVPSANIERNRKFVTRFSTFAPAKKQAFQNYVFEQNLKILFAK